MERWGQYYKPAGYGGRGDDEGGAKAAPAARPAPAPAAKPQVDEDETPPWEAPAATSTPAPKAESAGGEASSRAADIIAMIRNRQKSE
jgi:hypothetical protein